MQLFEPPVQKSATFSPCRRYRYSLSRRWSDRPLCTFIGLNPSTADENLDDPTIRRCIGFAKAWDCGGLMMLNLFAFRSTDPKALGTVADPIGKENDDVLFNWGRNGGPAIAAWGVGGAILDRGKKVAEMLVMLKCLGTTADGHPRHPLYLRRDAAPVAFDWTRIGHGLRVSR